MAGEDARLAREILREFTRRSLDSTRVAVRSSHGVVYIQGELRTIRGGAGDLEKEFHIICQNIRRKYQVRDIVADVTFH